MTPVETLQNFFAAPKNSYTPFHDDLMQFCEALSQTLFQQSNPKENPDHVALAFWLRKSHLAQMKKNFEQIDAIRVPRGLSFHIPPANIDVMLVYSWITSLLVGNSNVIRIPSSRTSDQDKLTGLIFNLLEQEQFSRIKAMNCFIHYGHEEAITALISQHADARIIWGGDDTIAKIRAIPLQAHAIDLAFPDRFSYGVIHAETCLHSDLQELATCVFNDIYWFDQSACSSPRMLFWVGSKETIETASTRFYEALQLVIQQRRYRLSLGGALLKKNFLFRQSLALPVTEVMQCSNELCIIKLIFANPLCREHCGQGLLYHIPITHLSEIAPFTTHKDQTLTTHGFSDKELRGLFSILNGKGITRIVPFGQALNFDPVWDGQDLFTLLTQQDQIQGAS